MLKHIELSFTTHWIALPFSEKFLIPRKPVPKFLSFSDVEHVLFDLQYKYGCKIKTKINLVNTAIGHAISIQIFQQLTCILIP